MLTANPVYRELQQHLDRQPVPFPATRSGVDQRLLERLFTPEEATVALRLTSRPQPLQARKCCWSPAP